jgi:hypothetical protein
MSLTAVDTAEAHDHESGDAKWFDEGLTLSLVADR